MAREFIICMCNDHVATAPGASVDTRFSGLGSGNQMTHPIEVPQPDPIATVPVLAGGGHLPGATSGALGFRAAKRAFDLAVALSALPVVGLVALVLLALNPMWNPGPLLFVQRRMGRHCAPFNALKFRTMRSAAAIARGPNDPVEVDRITPLGRVLRRTRIDELPQFLNVALGQMSVVGPRPDYWNHAVHYLDTVPGYRQRHAVRPGITGLAQVEGGYAEGIDATHLKTRVDLIYIRNFGWRMELYVLRRTVVVVFTGFGAR